MRTFFTVYGPEKGKKIVSFLLGFSLLIPLVLFHRLSDITFLTIIAPLVAWLFYIRGKLIIAYSATG
ncbi:MAG: hypothetical protein OEY18_14880 [Candidatus Aminicenantes bacterium]|nr:hypothetical protein [Candidatus Aminicenantes bacterium]